MLTGESVPSSKAVPAVLPAAPLGDRKCMCYRLVFQLNAQEDGHRLDPGLAVSSCSFDTHS